MSKKLVPILLAGAMMLTSLAACAKKPSPAAPGVSPSVENSDARDSESSQPEASAKKLSVVCVSFPEYDWTRQILGSHLDSVDLSFLLNTGVDRHSFQATADDIMKIAKADLFVYGGGESEAWVEDALKHTANPQQRVLKMMDCLGGNVKNEEVVPGMQAEDEHEHEHAEEAEHEHEHEHAEEAEHEHAGDAEDEHGHQHHHAEGEVEQDEHIWLSLRNAELICGAIATELSALDPANAADYAANLETYVQTLQNLDQNYVEMVKNARLKSILVGDRFPFRYLVDDYGIDYFAAFVGCSAETEASFETVSFLAKKADELGLNCILTLEKADQKIAKAIAGNSQNSNRKILQLNSLQSVTKDDVQGGLTYLAVMQDNLGVLKEALNS